jgi:hypothetical protein
MVLTSETLVGLMLPHRSSGVGGVGSRLEPDDPVVALPSRRFRW